MTASDEVTELPAFTSWGPTRQDEHGNDYRCGLSRCVARVGGERDDSGLPRMSLEELESLIKLLSPPQRGAIGIYLRSEGLELLQRAVDAEARERALRELLCDFIDAVHFIRTPREKEILAERGEELLGIKQERYHKVLARGALAQSEAGKGRDDEQGTTGAGEAGGDDRVPDNTDAGTTGADAVGMPLTPADASTGCIGEATAEPAGEAGRERGELTHAELLAKENAALTAEVARLKRNLEDNGTSIADLTYAVVEQQKRAEQAEAEVAGLDRIAGANLDKADEYARRAEQAEHELDGARRCYAIMTERLAKRAEAAESRLAQIGEMAQLRTER